ncbi:hypothetical protein FRC14_001062 [Serendipita sp. 396]|nr:hypothetical protein FRC14_001062 [Serendipita sp. 396]KAG8774640.1 hypothetical protein FRC15_001146 [Serendipita sp. 397]KAG8817114.1 hypothetical protein FRC18_000680 [Serendipita sp. 400]KAG8828149.1 hypothetical protein FRC19_009233 [Serendipita sp. 401]KAG8846119.1 hypothetical protein FRB91_001144 [Serendipita sp. 411]KAG8863423.1 hypothetical protein FRC20_010753 [Serendipita sp. 405]KAG9058455.1 hypothetical protein FS842_009523 [Serendipita sp. 407]
MDSSMVLKSAPLSPITIDETAERIITIHSESSDLFIACRPLLRILLDETIKPLSKNSSKLPYGRVFKWHQWGPENTIWLHMQPISPGFVAINGGRFCSLVESSQSIFITNKDIRNNDKEGKLSHEKSEGDGDNELDSLVVGIRGSPLDQDAQNGMWSILILDFNPRPILRAVSRREEVDEVVKIKDNDEGSWWRQFSKRTKTGKWGLKPLKLNEPKIGGLPFRAYQRLMERKCAHMILSIDHILMVTEDQTGYKVLQFVN